jgi:glycosyltransferase involved in cell wall biosynthesis
VKVLFIFEFGLPPYRRFIIDALHKLRADIRIVSGTDRFRGWKGSKERRLNRWLGEGESRFYWLNPYHVFDADIIFSTFNLRRPHTWIWIFVLPNKRWIFWGQGYWRKRNGLVEKVRRAALDRCSRYIAYTQHGKRNLIDWGFPEEKISVAFNTLDVGNSGWTSGRSYVLYVGRLQKRKELDLLIRLLPGTSLALRIVGDGVCLYELKDLVEQYRVSGQVEFHPGTFDEQTLKEHFSGAMAYISPGHVGLGVVHAFAYAVPVITLQNREHAPEFEYCNYSNSYICENERALAQLLGTLDADSAVHLGKKRAALELYETRLSPQCMVACFERELGFCR